MFNNCFYNCFFKKYNNIIIQNYENTNLINKNNNIILKISDGYIYKIPHPSNIKDLNLLINNFNKEINKNISDKTNFIKLNILNLQEKKNNDIIAKYIFNLVNIQNIKNDSIIPTVFFNNKFSMTIFKFNKNNMIMDDFNIYINIRKISNNTDISFSEWKFLEKIFTNIGLNCEIIFN